MTLTQLPTMPEALSDERDYRLRTAINERMGTFDLRPMEQVSESGITETLDLGDLLITDWCCSHVHGVRPNSMAKKDADAMLVLTVTTGRQIIQTPDETLVLQPGSLLLVSTRATGRFDIPEVVAKRTVRVPLAALTPYDTGAGVPDFLCLDTAHNPLALLTQDFLTGVGSQHDQMTSVDIEGARNALLVLIAGMIRATHAPDVGETDFLPFLRRAMEDWIIKHLTDGAIRVGDVAVAHNVAPRTVHRAFASTGDTMGSVVRAHRLAAARNDLVHTAASVAAIAHRWGFCDASHLGREFRREFSMSPGDYRAAHGIA